MAGIEYVDSAGRYVDFHSLRHTTATLLAVSGVQPKVAQELMRHSDINLTMNACTYTLRGQHAEAVEQLADLSAVAERQELAATGTEGESGSLSKACFSSTQQYTNQTVMNSTATDNGPKVRLCNDNKGASLPNCQEMTNARPIIRVRAASKKRTAPVEACATSHGIITITGQKDEA